MLETLVMAMEATTREDGTFPQACLGPDGWQKGNLAPTTSGQVISALLVCSRSFELDSHAYLGRRGTFDDSSSSLGREMSMGWNQGGLTFKVAHRFAQQILDDCFGEDGQLMTAAETQA